MFARGVALGLAIASTLAFGLVAYEVRFFEAMYRDMGNGRLPGLTRLVLGSIWHVGGPLVSAALVAVLAYRRPASLVPYITVLVAVTAAAVVTWYAIRLPIFELAGNIKAD